MLDYVFRIAKNDTACVMLLNTKQLVELDPAKTRLSDIVYKTGETVNCKDFEAHFYKAQDAINILSLDDKINHIING